MFEICSPPRKISKRWYRQNFRNEWLGDPELKDWLKEDSSEKGMSYCMFCEVKIKNANKSMLLAHKNTVKHKKKANIVQTSENTGTTSENIGTTSTTLETFFTKNSTEKEEIAKAELTIAAFISEHDMPFAQCDHIIEVCKKAFHDSNIAKKVQMKPTKVSYLIQDGIAYHEKIYISNICRNNKFSLIINESTDISSSQVLAVVVRYFDIQKLDVIDVLLDMVCVEKGTPEVLYRAVKNLFLEKNIPISNVVGFGSDNCGTKSGFQSLLKTDIPSVFIMGCVRHSFALCASHSVKLLPSFLETFIHDISCYFSHSSKGLNDFMMIQDAVNTDHHKIPKSPQTCWLSRSNLIKIIIEQWDALALYFQSQSTIDKIDGERNIYNTMITKGTKHMLVFLGYVLEKINILNIELQLEHFRLHLLHSMVSMEYENILRFFIKEEVLTSCKLVDIDPSNAINHKSLNDIYLGGRCMALLNSNPLGDGENRFKSDCLKFLVELCTQIGERFPLNDDGIIASLNVLDPTLVHDHAKSPSSIFHLAMQFPHLVSEDKIDLLDDEWRSFRLNKELDISYKTIPEFWYLLRNVKDGFNNTKYKVLSNFMTSLTILPYSSASVERIFSQVNCIKTKATNSLKSETVKDRLMAKQAIKRSYHNCYTWKPKPALIKEVVQGTCHKRYEARMKKMKGLQKINMEGTEYEENCNNN